MHRAEPHIFIFVEENHCDTHYRCSGGAGGLELATKLGRTLGRKNRARITLVDRKASHLWKPLLHEVATGSLDEGVDALSYRAHAKKTTASTSKWVSSRHRP